MKLNLGCGFRKLEGYVNVDKSLICSPDRRCDLEQFPWPFDSDSVSEVIMCHSLEHVGETCSAFIAVIKEMYRICRDGALIRITVPHPRSDDYLGDPTHVRPILPATLALFSRERNLHTIEQGFANSTLAIAYDVDFRMLSSDYVLSPEWSEKRRSGVITDQELDSLVLSFNNVVREIRMVLEVVKDRSAARL